MQRESVRRPSPASLVAIAVVALAATPIADAATRKPRFRPAPVVARARLADNATRVGGYRVSFVPTPDTLVPLGFDGRLPPSVIPPAVIPKNGATGPAGPRGPAGLSGLDSPGVVNVIFQANGTSADPTGVAEALCPAATKVLGGGFKDLTLLTDTLKATLPPNSVDEVAENDPFLGADGASGWRVRIVNVPTQVVTFDPISGKVLTASTPAPARTFFQAYAICG